MVRACQQLLPISRDPKPAGDAHGRSSSPRPEPIRWGSALATATPSWQQVSDRSTRGRRTVVYLNEQRSQGHSGRRAEGRRAESRLAAVVAAEPLVEPGGDVESGREDERNVIRHAVDLFGACMLIVALLAMAMFV